MVPVGLCVGSVGNGKVLSLAGNRPSSLGNPDRLAANSTLGVVEGFVEESSSLVDAIGFGVLEVWVGINTDPVGGTDDSVVGSVHPSSPGVDVADSNAAQGCA